MTSVSPVFSRTMVAQKPAPQSSNMFRETSTPPPVGLPELDELLELELDEELEELEELLLELDELELLLELDELLVLLELDELELLLELDELELLDELDELEELLELGPPVQSPASSPIPVIAK